MTIQIDWQNIDTILLDMDGTLLDLHFDNYFWRQHLPTVYAQQNQLSFEGAMAKFEPMFEKYAGSLNWYCVNFWSEQLGVDIMQLKQEVANKISYRPDARHFLRYCRETVSDLRLITNAHRDVLNLKIQHTQLDQYFDSMLCSHELDAPKEDQRFWKKLQMKQAFDIKRTLFVDDSEVVLDAAKEYGIANIFSIAAPDSQIARSVPSKYPMIENLLDTHAR